MRAGRHAAASFPFLAVVVVLVGGAVAAFLLTAADGDDAPAPGPGAAGTPSRTVHASLPQPAPEPQKGTLVIHGTGDVNLDPSYIPALAANGYGWAWSGLDGLFRHDDLTMINHECPSTRIVAPVPKQFNFRCDPAALPAAFAAGIDVATLGNNHAYDQGPEGLVDSIHNLRKAGITPIGAGEDEADATTPAMFELHGWRVAVLGFGEVLDPLDQTAGPDKPGTAAGHSVGEKLRAIRAAAARSDLVIVMIHWGVELDTRPRDDQVEEGHAMIDAGADVIFGGHSHRLQPLETYRGRPIFYSLGNFVWPVFSDAGSATAVAQVRVSPDGTVRGKLLPAVIASSGHPELR